MSPKPSLGVILFRSDKIKVILAVHVNSYFYFLFM